MKKISETKVANKKLEKKMKKAEAETMKIPFKVVLCENKFPTMDLIITAFGRCCALFIKAFIIGLAIKSALF